MAAYVVPFALFMALTLLESSGWVGVRYEVVYTIKVALVAAALWRFRREYPPFSTRGFVIAIVAGVIGCGVWIGLARLQPAIPGLQQAIDLMQQGGRASYDPFSGEGLTAGRMAFVAVRLIGLIAVVPIMEEVFWRGFLIRYLVAEDFRSVPQGVCTRWGFAIVTLAFAAAHPEILAAIAWGAVINVLYMRTANLWACVAMHACTNALLGGYILATKSWNLW